ncbi:MAG: hypothetical protein IT366_01735 [Candidatus Hydrogenedentes bacterium]|nr:hypothetical protein [Candidatus Hydrogenedentota bacterium]
MRTHYAQKITSPADVDRLFQELYLDVAEAHSRADLAELYSRAEYWASLAASPVWRRNLGNPKSVISTDGLFQFQRVARRINRRAKQIGLDAHFAESWRKK